MGSRKCKICIILLLSLGVLTSTGQNPSWGRGWATILRGDSSPSYFADELLVQTRFGVPKEQVAADLQAAGAAVISEISQIRVKQIKVPAHALERVQAALSRNPHFNFVEHNFIAEATATPNDSYFPSQWHLQRISAPSGWDISSGSESIIIAIIDSGVDPSHPDLADKLLPGYNFLSDNTDTHDVLGHGTAVAGAAAAISNNYGGVAGVAWANPIMPLVVLNSSNYASYYDIAQAITFAADHGAKIMNISIGGSSSSSTLQNAADYAWNKGAIIFASAANYSTSAPYYPAACNNVVAVSATASNDALASFSNYGNWVDIAAPGVSIYTTSNGGSYSARSGTSFSSPVAAGVGALIMSANPSLANAQVLDILLRNSDDLGASGFDPYFGYGRVNAYRSLLAAISSAPERDTAAPIVSIVSPANNSLISGTVTISTSANDDVGVSKVELYVDGILYGMDSDQPYNFSWDTTKSQNGSHNLEAVAYDQAGNAGESSPLTVFVDNPLDTTPPIVSIDSPQDGSYVTRKVTIAVKASDNMKIGRIELYIDGVLKSATSSSTSLVYNWNPTKATKGGHIISSKAYDAAGNVNTDSITLYK
jgi:subtilisin family serine protease